MKQWIFAGILLVGFSSQAQLAEPAALSPLTDSDLASVRHNLQSQANVLERQSAVQCEAAYNSIFENGSPEVRIGLFYGYQDAETSVADGPYAYSLAGLLQKPCQTAAVEACGFTLTKSESGMYELTRNLQRGSGTKKIVVTVAYPSVSYSNRYNTDLDRGYWDQRHQSIKTEERFYEALKNSQVIFYDGHSRLGAGPGFYPVTLLTEGVTALRRKPLQHLTSALATTGQSVKMFGYFACSSEEHFEEALLQARPELGVIVTKDAVDAFDSEQSVLGALNSVLMRKCETEFLESLVPEGHPNRKLTVLKNFFKLSPASAGGVQP